MTQMVLTSAYFQVPTASAVVDGNVALNKCRWHSSGKQIAVGDDHGHIHIYDVGEVRGRTIFYVFIVFGAIQVLRNTFDLDSTPTHPRVTLIKLNHTSS